MYKDCINKIAFAQYYSEKGLAVFPCHTNENGKCSCGKDNCSDIAKHPLTPSGVKDATKDIEEIKRYFGNEYEIANIAIAAGEPSGVWILDVDDETSLSNLEAVYGALPKTWKSQTGSGTWHYFFKYNDKCSNLKNVVKFNGNLDVRSTGSYAIVAPSVHRSGNQYKWIVSPDEIEPAEAPDWLIALIPKHELVETANIPSSQVPSVNDVPTPDDQSLIVQSGFTIQRATSEVERLKLYLEATPPAISGENGHAATFAVMCRLVEVFGALTDDEIVDTMDDWNSRCSPSWTEAQLMHKLKDARQKTSVITIETTPDVQSEVVVNLYPTLESSAYQGIAGEILNAIDPETEADIAGVLLSFLCAFGNAVGNGPHVKVGATQHCTNLNVALCGDTASGKGQAWDVCRRLMSSDDEWLKSSIAYGLSSGEGLVDRLSDPIEDDPLNVPELKRLLCLETEFARPITAMRRDGNTLSPLLRSAWDGQTLEIMTRGKSKLKASNAHVSVLAHITIEELRKLLSGSIEIVNGFGNRFLWTLVRSTKSLPHGGNVEVLNVFKNRLKSIIEHAKTCLELKRSAEADKLWESVYNGLKESKPGIWGKSVERGRPYVVRLSLIYALLDCSPTIETTHLQAALAVWRYCEESAYAIFSEENDDLTLRLRALVNQTPGIKRSELRKAVSHSIKTQAFDSALKWLIQRGDIVSVQSIEVRNCEVFYPGVRRSASKEPIKLYNETVVQAEASVETPSLYNDQLNLVSTTTSTITETIVKTNATITESVPTAIEPASLSELLNWKNANSVTFYQNDDGEIWVTVSTTPAIQAALELHRATLTHIAEKDPDKVSAAFFGQIRTDYANAANASDSSFEAFEKRIRSIADNASKQL